MCGRYQTSDDAQREIRPGDLAVIIAAKGEKQLHWGVKAPDNRLIINARSETAHTKPMFRNAMLRGRCIVKASAFFEWDAKKHCHAFASPNGEALYMAALFMLTDDGSERFVILTQPAKNGAEKVHPRMPCLLQSSEYRHLWLHDDDMAPHLLNEDAKLTIQQLPADAEQLDFFIS